MNKLYNKKVLCVTWTISLLFLMCTVDLQVKKKRKELKKEGKEHEVPEDDSEKVSLVHVMYITKEKGKYKTTIATFSVQC